MGDINLRTKINNLTEELCTTNVNVDEVVEKLNKSNDFLYSINIVNPTLENTSKNGVTCTNNGDGTYTLNGTASGGTATFVVQENITLKKGTYKLLGLPKPKNNNIAIQVYKTESPYTNYGTDSTGNGLIFTLPNDDKVTFLCIVYNEKSVNNDIFKPMITTDLDATNDDFMRYVKSNVVLDTELTMLIKTLKSKGVID